MKFDVSVGSKAVSQSLQAHGRMVSYAAASALTSLARQTSFAVQGKMPQSFDRPTPFTVRRVAWQQADKSSLKAVMGIPASAAAAGRSTSEYMRPGFLSAFARMQKKTEFLLSRRGLLPAGWTMIPGSFLNKQLDGYGNVPGSYYKQVIRSLQVRSEGDRYFKGISKASQKRATRMGVTNEFFAAGPNNQGLSKSGGRLAPGVYKRSGPAGKKLLQYFQFVPKAKYEQRLDMGAVAMEVVQAQGQKIWQDAMTSMASKFSSNPR